MINQVFAPISHLYALCAVLVGWVLFRSETVGQATSMLTKMFYLAPAPTDLSVYQILTGEEMAAFAFAIAFSIPFTIRIVGLAIPLPHDPPWESIAPWPKYLLGSVVGLAVLLLASIKIITGAFSPFIYFRF